MRLSLEFLYHKLNKKNSQLLLHGRDNPFFLGAGIYSSTLEPNPDTVYICPSNLFGAVDGEEFVDCSGMIWLGAQKPPERIPALWIRDTWDYIPIFNEVAEIFQTFQKWSALVYDAVAKRKPLYEIFHLLTLVTPNPWYLADPSFRMVVIKDEPDYCEISPIWRYQYAHGHLPIDVVFRLISSGELDLMNSTTEAYPFYKTISFVNGFVSKTIFSPKGVIGHFYLIGMYGRPTAYELEISEFFGNVLTELLQHDPDYLPSAGGFYDYYFIDLLEGEATDEEMLLSVLDNLHWRKEDIYRVMVAEACYRDSIEQSINNLQIHLFEESFSCKAFLYRDQIVVLINESQQRPSQNPLSQESIISFERETRRILNQVDSSAGYSESFRGLAQFQKFYQQAKVALDYASEDSSAGCLLSYSKISTRHLISTLYQTLAHHLICHPAVEFLRAYDQENNTELADTLRCYLENERNTQKSAQKLFIHRNSLMYRMDRIKELVQIDLNNPDERLRLLISFYSPE